MIITDVSPNGLSEAMARAIASKGPSLLVFTARSTSKAEAVSKQLGADSPSVKTRVFPLKLSSQKGVRQAARELENMTNALDVLMNNAGVMAASERTLLEDGEIQFATHYLGHFLFTNLIMTSSWFLPIRALVLHESSTLLALDTFSPPCALTIIASRGYQSLMKSNQIRLIASRMGMPELDTQGCVLSLQHGQYVIHDGDCEKFEEQGRLFLHFSPWT